MRTERTTRLEREFDQNAMAESGTAMDLYFGGDMEASIALTGQVCGRIEEIKPVVQIIDEIRTEFFEVIRDLAAQYADVP